MAKRNLPKRLFKTPDRVSSYQHDRSPTSRMKHMARDHEDVLQNIEFALVNGHREDPEIDDRDVFEALRVSLNDGETDEERVDGLVMALRATRQFREDITDDVWREALRVVADSVKRHSERRPGETSYLSFAGQFV
jgi:uncharacterized alpha-E superfamily protein